MPPIATLPAPAKLSAPPPITLLGSQTLKGLGHAQGLTCRNGFVYVFGDAETGIVREYRLSRDPLRLTPTGRAIHLTQHGHDLLPHPTGVAHRPGLPTFFGDTVRGRGVIWYVELDLAAADGHLNRAVLNRCLDTVATNGCRPEYARYQGRWVVATSDYGPAGNEIRLYDPHRLARSSRTCDPGVLIARFPCGPWVQSLRWLDDEGALVLVQNQACGRGYRLTTIRLEMPHAAPDVLDLAHPADELEGFAVVEPGLALLVSSSLTDNVWFARVEAKPPLARAA